MDIENLTIYDYILIQRRERLDPKGEKFDRNSLIVYSEEKCINLIKEGFSVKTSERKKRKLKILKSLKFATKTSLKKVKGKIEENQEYFDNLKSLDLSLLDQRIVCTNLHVFNGKLIDDPKLFSGYILQSFEEGSLNSAREIQIAENLTGIYDIFQDILVGLIKIINSSDSDKIYFDVKPSNYIKKGKIFVDTQIPWGVKKEELINFLSENDFPKNSARDIIERLTTKRGLLKKISEQSISLRPDLKGELETIVLDILADNKKELVDNLKKYFLSGSWKRKINRYYKRFLGEKNEF